MSGVGLWALGHAALGCGGTVVTESMCGGESDSAHGDQTAMREGKDWVPTSVPRPPPVTKLPHTSPYLLNVELPVALWAGDEAFNTLGFGDTPCLACSGQGCVGPQEVIHASR